MLDDCRCHKLNSKLTKPIGQFGRDVKKAASSEMDLEPAYYISGAIFFEETGNQIIIKIKKDCGLRRVRVENPGDGTGIKLVQIL
ncbi:hypothetical protein [Anaerotignum sp.]|uniref:hypothetical protein n=1 Tax=Anaerotignum sp. TaxID=2039241 RepID=UPI002714B7A5|nr:hypothetical protein [Anaerotignum sp.]